VHLVRDRGRFIDRVESVNGYSYRHLKTKETMRAKRFIKILCLLPSVDFELDRIQVKAKAHIDFILNKPLQIGEHSSVEIVPFHHLLPLVFKELKLSKRQAG